jgi:hypothetical protein
VRARALPFLAASSAAFAASSAFGLALLGAIAGGVAAPPHGGRQMLELALSSKEANRGEQWRQQGYVLGCNSSVNLASHGHCAGVFIGV